MSGCGCSPPLESPDADIRSVLCSGPLLDRVQRSNMFPNSKHFVDMSCVYTPAQTMADYEMFSNCARNDGSLEFLQMFVEMHFKPPGSELEPWTPKDWKPQPSFLSRVSDPQIKQFAAEINELWKQMGRRIKDEVQENPEMYSIIYVPKPFIIRDTNCREYSYWDSFWIIRGLLQCGMIQTARGMIENFLFLVHQYGYVPACGRIYCLERTQPPLLIMMMKAYVEVTKDEQFAIQSLPLLETEFENFVSQRSIEVKGRTMYQYRSVSSAPGPRPETYAEDLAAAEKLKEEQSRENYYAELKSASESGQEFSSRWFVGKGSSSEAILSDTKPSAIVPVELNAIIFRSGKILAEFNRKAGNAKRAEEYQDRSCVLVKAIRDVLWSSQAGIWLDYDVEKKQSRNFFCCTNFAPLWARAFPLIDTEKVSKGVMDYIKTNKLDDLYGGVPHTLNKKAGEKWDYPNVFPPMMFMVVEGLDNLGTRASKAMSRRWAHRWVKSNYVAFKAQGFMLEKNFCEEFGGSGAPPTEPAVGYGWSNAVIIEFLCKYGREISMSDDEDKACQCKAGKKKDSYVITSNASMETNAFLMATSREMEKKKACVCEDLISKTTAAIGTQSSAFRPSSSAKSMDRKSSNCGQLCDDCSCAPVVKKPVKECCCGSGRSYSTGRSRYQEVPTCSCSVSRTQMMPVDPGAEHFSDCPCYHSQGKRRRSSSKHKEKQPKQPKQPKQQKQPKQKEGDVSCCCSSEHQNLNKKQRKQQEQMSRCPSVEQQNSNKKQRKQQEQMQQQEELSRCSSEEQPNLTKKSSKTKDKKKGDPELSEEDRERERMKRQANLVGHYAPLADLTEDDCPKQEPKKKNRCCDCNDEGASDDDLECGERRNSSNEVYFSPEPTSTFGSCSCSTGPSAQPSRAQGQRKSSDDCSNSEDSGAQGKAKKSKPCKSQSQHSTAQSQEAAPDCLCPGGLGETARASASQSSVSHGKVAHGKGGGFKLCRPKRSDQNAATDCACFEANIGADDIWCAPCPGGKHAQGNAAGKKAQGRRGHDRSTQSTTAVCPHCGGAYSDQNTASSTQSISKDKQEDYKTDCEQTHMRGLSAIGLQRGCCKPESRSRAHDCGSNRTTKGMFNYGKHNEENPGYYEGAGEYCSCHGESGGQNIPPPNIPAPKKDFETPVYGPEPVPCSCPPDPVPSGRQAPVSSARADPAEASTGGPCASHEANEYAATKGPTPMYNKLFPLKDPVSTDQVCVPKKKEKTSKCCQCKENEEEQ